MAEFTYQAKDGAGKTKGGTVFAANEADAIGELRKQNLTVVSLTEKAGKGGGWNIGALFGGGAKKQAWKGVYVKEADLIVFTRQLATMLGAGIPLLECLEILAEQAEDPKFRAVLIQCVDDVRGG